MSKGSVRLPHVSATSWTHTGFVVWLLCGGIIANNQTALIVFKMAIPTQVGKIFVEYNKLPFNHCIICTVSQPLTHYTVFDKKNNSRVQGHNAIQVLCFLVWAFFSWGPLMLWDDETYQNCFLNVHQKLLNKTHVFASRSKLKSGKMCE